MKKIAIFLITAFPLFANEANLTSKHENLDHLFNTKFPVSDYIYKAGFKESENENDYSKLFGDKDTKMPPQMLNLESKFDDNKSRLDKIKEQKENLQNEQKKLENEIKTETNNNQNTNKKQRINKLLRDSILADRTGETKTFVSNDKFGADGFSNQKSIDISTNEHKLFRTIRAGRLIPALLTSSISSDLSGIVTAQIEEDIYASMGRAVLLPRGSKAIGFYTNEIQNGQDRLQIKWREIITPQGVNILLTDAIVADNMGMNGATGALNNKYWERYGIPYGISTLTNALLLGIASKIEGNNVYAEEIYSSSRADISTIVEEIINQQSQIKPTIEIKSGSRIFIVPTNHMWFSKPKNGEVLMKYFID